MCTKMDSKFSSLSGLLILFVLSISLDRVFGKDLSHAPPVKVTAQKIERYFLNLEPKTAESRHSKRQAGSSQVKYNVVYVLDSSSSISNREFRFGIKALKLLTSKALANTTYAMVLFASHARVVSDFTTPQEMIRRLSGVKRMWGGTNTQHALEVCRTQLFNPKSRQWTRGAVNRVILVTDGLSNINRDRTLFKAFQLKMRNIDVLVIGVGRIFYGVHEILAIASTHTSHVFRVESMRGLFEVVQWITLKYDDDDEYWPRNGK